MEVHTHLRFIIPPALWCDCCQTLIVPVEASTVIDYQTEFVSVQHWAACVPRVCPAWGVKNEMKKMKSPLEYANIYTLSTCWSQCCYAMWNMHVFEFLMSDFFKYHTTAGVGQTMWSVTDVVPAVNLSVALRWLLGQHALSSWNSWTITALSSLLLFYIIFNCMTTVLGWLTETGRVYLFKVWINNSGFLKNEGLRWP